MSTVNLLAREVAAKIVFYGPGLSGKTTTLKRIYDSIKPAHRGEMVSLPTEADRTLFFDFLPVRVEKVGDCSVRLALYTVPGQVFYNATRKLVLQGADGVVFVADSQPEALDSNVESMRNLEENLWEQGLRLEHFPLVVQYNKRDISKSLPVAELRAALNPREVPDFETCATNGRGILDTLKAITRLVIKDLRAKRVVAPPRKRPAVPGIEPLPEGSAGLEEQIQQHLEAQPAPPALADAPPLATPHAGVRALSIAIDQRSSELATGVALRRVEPGPSPKGMGPSAALAPSALLDYAQAADRAFASGDHEGCIRACQEAVRRALAYTGEATAGAQAYLLGVDGADLTRLQATSARAQVRVDDAAFALYVLMQVFTRLSAAGLVEPSP